MADIINHNPQTHRFVLAKDGETAYVEYVLNEDSLDITHTFVPKSLEGQGIASALVKEAYDYALGKGLWPKATCSYAVVWLKRHSEYQTPGLSPEK